MVLERSMHSKLLNILFLCLLPSLLWAQAPGLSNWRHKTIKVEPGKILLDSLSIAPYSLSLTNTQNGQPIDSSYYLLYNNELTWLPTATGLADSAWVSYRVLSFNLGERYSNLDTTNIQRNELGEIIGFDYNPFADEEQIIDFRGLDYNGNFSRGISFGNNQDLVLNSSFNLQLAGNLGEGIEILAAITDENIPLQPEGNTQQLREFDRIFIQLKKGKNQLTAGDYELKRPNSYFMNYFKKLQGATFSNQTSVLKNGILTSSASVAISRGQFARNQIAQQEGNQGPYKLQGSEGERFIIVLAGTEKVWIDGELLKRGLEEDYVIDYNRGELTFTNKRLITKDTRIIVEFEYSDQSYLRSMYALNTEYQSKKFRTYLNVFNQQDSKTSTGNVELTDAEKRSLKEAGDNFTQAIVPSIDTIEEFNAFQVAYKLIDSLYSCNGVDTLISYLVYSTNPDSAIYKARFSFVGPGNGQYVLDPQQVANERVYKWVGFDPISCLPLGDYEPIVQLVAPKQQQLFTLGGEYRFSKKARWLTEVALSRNDLNRFSTLDQQDDVGMAVYSTFQKDFLLSSDTAGWKLTTNLSYEFVQETFQALNPYRNPEFLRDWNIANVQGIGQAERAVEQLAKGGFRLHKSKFGSFDYTFSGFLRDSLYTGLRHAATLKIKSNGWDINGEGSFLSTDEVQKRTQFFRPRLSIVKTFKQLNNWRLGAKGEREKSDRYQGTSDTLSLSSFFYDRYQLFLQSPEGKKSALGLNYSQRIDNAPDGLDYTQSTKANEFNVNGQLKVKRNINLGGNFTYRNLEIIDSTLTNEDPAETFLGRTTMGMNLIKGVIRSNTTYEIGSGQEPKLEFTYVRVNQGEGSYIWLDSLFNNDGVIQPNEMEIAPFQDQADYVRVTTFTNEFIRSNNVSLNQSLLINPKAAWFNTKGIRKFLARISTQSTLKITRKTQDAEGVSRWNPFQLNVADSALVAVSSNIRNIFFFNRSNPKFDFQVGQSENRNKIVQTSGFESRRNEEQFFRGRWNISKSISTQIALTQGERASDSEFFDNKDFVIEFWKVEPQLTFLPSKTFRTIFRYKYQEDLNVLGESGESAIMHDLNLESTFNQSSKTSIRLQFSFVNIAFNGQANSPVGFAILNGLQNGENFLWNLSLNRQLAKNIQLNITYEGRKTGNARVVHVGRAQVAATF